MLHWAAEKGHGDLCKYLVSLNADPEAMDSQDRTPIECAENKGRRDIVAILQDLRLEFHDTVSRGLSVQQSSSDGSSARRSARSGDAEESAKAIPEAYIKVIEQIDTIGWDKMQWARGFTLLHWAAKNNRADLCAKFMRQGADPEQQDDSGRTAIDYATDNNSADALEMLETGPDEEDDSEMETLHVSHRPRQSDAVFAQPRPSVLRRMQG